MERELTRARRGVAAFTLLELIGVLAIISILAAVAVPSSLRLIDQATVRREAEVLRALGEHTRLYVRQHGTAPTAAAWAAALAPLADLSAAQLATNSRQVARVFIPESGTPTPRVILLSCMNGGLTLPTAAQVTGARFQTLWDTPEADLPAWAGWWPGSAAWTAGTLQDQQWRRESLVIERINLEPIYRTELMTVAVTLNNRAAVGVTYDIVRATGPSQTGVPLPAGQAVTLATLRPRDRLNLYRAGPALDYSYVVSTTPPPSFKFEAGAWTSE